MKLFKNRGDIYIPKTGRGSSKEAKILFSLLIFIVIFTVVFLAFLSHRYSTAAEFFGDGEVTVSENAVNDEIILPHIEGKTNYLILETDDSGNNIHYMLLIQADKSSLAYKVAALSPALMLDNESAQELFHTGGGAALQKRLTEYLGLEIDFYAVFDTSSFVEFVGKLGSIIYPLNENVRFSGGEEDDKYTLHLNEGEQKLSGRDVTNLLRYFSEEKKDYFSESELALKVLTGLLNPENYEKSESLFRLFIKSCQTDITVRDFENGRNPLYVFCKKNTDITVYPVQTQYDENSSLSQEALKEIKGYFNK